MNIYTTSTATLLHYFTSCLERDMGKVAGWGCIIMPSLLPPEGAAMVMQALSVRFAPHDGALLQGANGDLLVVYRKEGGIHPSRFIEGVREAVRVKPSEEDAESSRSYDVAGQWLSVLEEFRNQLRRLGRWQDGKTALFSSDAQWNQQRAKTAIA
jgi:hypothetical protein